MLSLLDRLALALEALNAQSKPISISTIEDCDPELCSLLRNSPADETVPLLPAAEILSISEELETLTGDQGSLEAELEALRRTVILVERRKQLTADIDIARRSRRERREESVPEPTEPHRKPIPGPTPDWPDVLGLSREWRGSTPGYTYSTPDGTKIVICKCIDGWGASAECSGEKVLVPGIHKKPKDALEAAKLELISWLRTHIGSRPETDFDRDVRHDLFDPEDSALAEFPKYPTTRFPC